MPILCDETSVIFFSDHPLMMLWWRAEGVTNWFKTSLWWFCFTRTFLSFKMMAKCQYWFIDSISEMFPKMALNFTKKISWNWFHEKSVFWIKMWTKMKGSHKLRPQKKCRTSSSFYNQSSIFFFLHWFHCYVKMDQAYEKA